MRGAWRVAAVRTAEEALMKTLPEGALMQRAAAGLARRCALLLDSVTGGVYGGRVLVLVGAGNNGGDALYAGARLAGRGAVVSALLLAPRRAHAGGLAALGRAGGQVVDAVPANVDLVVDGIVGIGGAAGLRDRAAAVVESIGDGPVVVAVDVPSGVAVDTGDVSGAAVKADVTVTFGCLKPALVVGAAAPLAGQVDLVDIGLGPWLRGDPAIEVPERSDIGHWWPRLDPSSEKYTRGVVGVATGSATYPGAAVLSVGGALAGPTGLVRYAGSARAQVLAQHPSVIASERVGDTGRVQAWVCGSGLGGGEDALTAVRAVLGKPVPAVLDADGLNLLVSGTGEVGGGSMADWLRSRHAPVVVTPHDREFARLAGSAPGADRVGAALRLAAWMNAVVLLKGDRTIVASPSGKAWVNPTGTPELATGGTGDVLAGLLGSLLAARLTPERAAVAAAYLHGLAGREAARHGPVTAVEVAAALRPVIAATLSRPPTLADHELSSVKANISRR